jgi:zinc protease
MMLLALSAGSAAAAERQYDFKEKTLDNGLRVITLEDFSCPIVAVQVWYHVGSKDENPERQGFAHMFEHMMFRGTERLGPKDHFEFTRRTGGDCNAYTAFDNTTYVNELPANQLELALWLEAERMAFLKIDQESFDTERKVVEEERRLGLNAPYGTVPEKVLPVLFKNHPYRWSPIGQIPHLRAATIDELASFWDLYYVPGTATLVIVGAVKHADAQALAEKCFGWIPRAPQPPRVQQPEPPQTEPRELVIKEDKGPVPIVGYLFRTVPENHADATALKILMSVLGGGESSRLYHDLVKDKKICQVAMAGAFGLEDDGLAGAGAVLMPWGNKDKVLAEVERHLQQVREQPLTPRELDKAKNQMMRGLVTESLSVASKATQLGQATLIYQDPARANARLQEIRAVTLEDVQRVAQKYLVPERRTTVRVEPSLGGMLKSLFGGGQGPSEDEGAAPVAAAAEPNRVAPRTGPKAAAQRPAGFPAAPPLKPLLDEIPEIAHVGRTLPNGLKVVVIPNHEVPFVTLQLSLKYGAWTEDAARPGVASMTLGMLTQGTSRFTAAQLAEEIEYNAMTLGGSAGMDTASVSASCLADKVPLAIELLAEVALHPTFPPDEFDILRQQTLMGLMVSEKEPSYVADREFRRCLYGAHPYARTATGESEDVSRLTPGDLAAWWKTFARPDGAVLYVAGDVQPEPVFALAEKQLGAWTASGPAPEPQLPTIPASSTMAITLVDRPGSVQSQIRAGHAAITRGHHDYHATRVLTQVFGGAFSSRLNEALRVKRGLTYGAGGGFSAQRLAGQFSVGTFSKTPQTAETVQALIDEVRRLRSSPPTEAELDIARSYLVGSFAGDRETPQATVGDLWLIESSQLPEDYLQQALAAYKGATEAEQARITAAHVDADKLTIVVVGDAQRIQADLAKIAPVTLIAAPGAPAPAADAPPQGG